MCGPGYEFERAARDPRTTAELFARALAATDEYDDAYWCSVESLQKRGTLEVFEAAATLAFSADARERKLGVLTISKLGTPELKFRAEAERLLLEVYALESDAEVLEEIASALRWTGSGWSTGEVIALSRHAEEDVRLAAAFTLGSRLQEDARQARLVELTQDPCASVRDIATWWLAKSELDTPELLNVFVWRTRDTDAEVRAEAMHGLAKRKDARVVEPLLKELAGEPGALVLEAAEEIADPRLYPTLKRLIVRGGYDDSDELDRALAACRPGEDEEVEEGCDLDRSEIDSTP